MMKLKLSQKSSSDLENQRMPFLRDGDRFQSENLPNLQIRIPSALTLDRLVGNHLIDCLDY